MTTREWAWHLGWGGRASLIATTGLIGCAAERPSFEERFDDGTVLTTLRCTDPAAWKHDDGSLWQFDASTYTPRHRSPHNIVLLPVFVGGDFVLEADLMQTGREYAHRDLCVFFGVQSPDKMLYAHLSTAADPNAHHVQVVDDAPRTPITTDRSDGVDWGRDVWHHVRLEVDADAATIRVLFDGEEVLASTRLPWSRGFVGFGSFDDEGRVDNVRIEAATIEPRVPGFWRASTPPAGAPASRPRRAGADDA